MPQKSRIEEALSKYNLEITDEEVKEAVKKIIAEKVPENDTAEVKRFMFGSIELTTLTTQDSAESVLQLVEKVNKFDSEYPQMPHYTIDEEHEKIPAGWMIEQCGWKGRALGPAAVHDRQALVLVNRGGATGEDISRLSEAVRAAVKERFGVDVRPEVNFL